MTELQRRVLNLLLEIDRLCRENDIEYYLAAGSSIGAVRHHGFLPWDDDADVYMTHENWEKFRPLGAQLPDDRALITVDDGDYTSEYTINRYADISTTRMYRYLCSSPQEAGIAVDIIVLDPVPDNEEDIRRHVIDLTEYSNYLIVACAHGMRCPYDLNDEEIIKLGEKIGRTAMLDELKARSERYKDTKGGVLIQRDPTVPHVWKEEVFGKPQYVQFEDTKLPIAAKPYLQLTGAFNEDWMYVPETVNREEHIKGVIFDISSNNPLDDYLSNIDAAAVHKDMVDVTQGTNLLAPLNKKQNHKRLMMTAAKVRLKYRKLGIDPQQLEQWTRQRDHEKLNEYFEEYTTIQCDKQLIGSVAVRNWLMSQMPFYIDISDEFLYYFLRNYMHEPNIGRAHVILKGRLDAKEPTARINEIKELIDACNTLSDQMEQGKYGEIIEEVTALHQKYPENLRISQLYFACRYYLAESDDDLRSLEQEISSLPDCDRFESVVQCILASIFEKTDRYGEALRIYDELTQNSAHGLVLLYIKEKFEDSDVEDERRVSMQAEVKLGSPKEVSEDDEEDETGEGESDERESGTDETGSDDSDVEESEAEEPGEDDPRSEEQK